MTRSSGRASNELRPIEIIIGANKHAEGSCLIKCGDTHVMCTASVEERVPMWLKGANQGWVTAEYGMLPRSTGVRVDREAKKGQCGRTHEIQRLIGRALRAVVDMKALSGITIKIDCDVIQADGGTRTASITGAFVAMHLAFQKLMAEGKIKQMPISDYVAAISCGIVDGVAVLDLDYEEDSHAGTDANFVMTGSGKIIEIQGTAEGTPFTPDEFMQLMALAQGGITTLITQQKDILASE